MPINFAAYPCKTSSNTSALHLAPSCFYTAPYGSQYLPLPDGTPGMVVTFAEQLCSFAAMSMGTQQLAHVMDHGSSDSSVTLPALMPKLLGYVQQLKMRMDWGNGAAKVVVAAWQVACSHAEHAEVGGGLAVPEPARGEVLCGGVVCVSVCVHASLQASVLLVDKPVQPLAVCERHSICCLCLAECIDITLLHLQTSRPLLPCTSPWL